MNPVVDGIQSSYGRRVKFVYVDVSTPDGKQRVRDYGAMGTPTFVLLDQAGNQVYMIQGVQPRVVLEKALDEVLARGN
jgi:predicted DsbA family dithiol-disulfide isomerase